MSAIQILGKLNPFRELETLSWEVNYFSHNHAFLDMKYFGWETAPDETWGKIGPLRNEFNLIQETGKVAVAIPTTSFKVIQYLQDYYTKDTEVTISLTAAYSTFVSGYKAITKATGVGKGDPEGYAFLNNYLIAVELKWAKIAGLLSRVSPVRKEIFYVANFEASSGHPPMMAESGRSR